MTQFGIDYDSLMEMDSKIFSEICEHINNRNKNQRKITQREKDMIAENKKDEWWKDGTGKHNN